MNEDRTPGEDALRAEIEQTRAELGETVAELAARTHVSARAKDAAARTAGQVKDAGAAALDDMKHAAAKGRRFVPLAFLSAVATSVAGWRVWHGRRR